MSMYNRTRGMMMNRTNVSRTLSKISRGLELFEIFQHRSEKDEGPDEAAGDQPELSVQPVRHVNAEQIVDPGQGYADARHQGDGSKPGSGEAKNKRFVIPPEPVDLAPGGVRREGEKKRARSREGPRTVCRSPDPTKSG